MEHTASPNTDVGVVSIEGLLVFVAVCVPFEVCWSVCLIGKHNFFPSGFISVFISMFSPSRALPSGKFAALSIARSTERKSAGEKDASVHDEDCSLSDDFTGVESAIALDS